MHQARAPQPVGALFFASYCSPRIRLAPERIPNVIAWSPANPVWRFEHPTLKIGLQVGPAVRFGPLSTLATG
jgi:hypothetical protein